VKNETRARRSLSLPCEGLQLRFSRGRQIVPAHALDRAGQGVELAQASVVGQHCTQTLEGPLGTERPQLLWGFDTSPAQATGEHRSHVGKRLELGHNGAIVVMLAGQSAR